MGTGVCYTYRNAICQQHTCFCPAGTCQIDGECVQPGDCKKNTGGSCNLLGCHASRNSTCLTTPGYWFHGKQCVCASDECAVDGECVKKTAIADNQTEVVQALAAVPSSVTIPR